MLKKVFFVALFIFIVALSALIVQKVFFSEENKKQEVAQEEILPDPKQEVEKRREEDNKKRVEKIIKLVDSGIKGATLAGNSSQVLYYQNQRFLLIDFNANAKNSIGAYPFVDVKGMEWNLKKEKALVKDQNRYYLYDLNENKVKELDQSVDVAVWNYAGNRIFYKYYDAETGKRSLASMNVDNFEEKEIIVEEIPYKKVDLLSVPKKNEICFFPSPDANTKGFFECYDAQKKEKTFEYAGNFGAEYLWSKKAKRILVSYLQDRGAGRLLTGAGNERGSEFKGLNFSTTTKKCAWSNDEENVYCGLMGGLSGSFVNLPNEWIEGDFQSVDTFWKVNTVNGKKERLLDVEKLPGQVDTMDLFIDATERYLFFTNRRDGSLYRVVL